MCKIDYESIIESCRYHHIRFIFNLIQFYDDKDINISIEDAKIIFMSILRYLMNKGEIKLLFVDNGFSEEKNNILNTSDIETQLNALYNSFPIEYDENIPEKDIDNSWWYISCPVIIGWKNDDGSYYYAD